MDKFYERLVKYKEGMVKIFEFDRQHPIENEQLNKLLKNKVDIEKINSHDLFVKYNELSKILLRFKKIINLFNIFGTRKLNKSFVSEQKVCNLDSILNKINKDFQILKININNSYNQEIHNINLSKEQLKKKFKDDISYGFLADLIHIQLDKFYDPDLINLLDKIKMKVLQAEYIEVKFPLNLHFKQTEINLPNWFSKMGFKYEHTLEFFKKTSKSLKTNFLIFNLTSMNNVNYNMNMLFSDASKSIVYKEKQVLKGPFVSYINYDKTNKYIILKILGHNAFLMSNIVVHNDSKFDDIKTHFTFDNRRFLYNKILEDRIFEKDIVQSKVILDIKDTVNLSELKFELKQEENLKSVLIKIREQIEDLFQTEVYEYIFIYDDFIKKIETHLETLNLNEAIDETFKQLNIYEKVRDLIVDL